MSKWGAIAQAAGSLLGGITTGIFNASAAHKNRRHDLFMAQYKQRVDLENWNRQNEYNHPAAQMARYREAGLNPHMIAGSASSGNAQAIPEYQAPPAGHTNPIPENIIQNTIGTYLDAQTKQTQNKILQQQLRLTESEANMKKLDEAVKKLDTEDYIQNTKFPPVGDTDLSKSGVLSKYQTQQLERYHKLRQAQAKTFLDETITKVKTSPEQLNYDKKVDEEKLKALGLENEFKAHRNKLAKIGLTFSSNEWAVIVAEVTDWIYNFYKNQKDAKKKKVQN